MKVEEQKREREAENICNSARMSRIRKHHRNLLWIHLKKYYSNISKYQYIYLLA